MQLSGSRNAADVGKPRRRGSLSIADGNQHHHAVQFYETDAFLVRSVTNFIIDGLKAEEPALIIATAEHRDGIEAALMSHGVDVEWSKRRGLLTEFDARYTLSSIMSGGVPDEALFRRQIEPALENVRRRRRSSSVRAYGEMVNLLWCDGNGGAALALEALWNQLAETQQFSLLCGYCMSLFDAAADSKILSALCGEHTHVVPTERYLERDDMSRLVEITSLQQRADALVFPQMQAKGVRYTYDGCDPGIVVRVDSEKLQQILLNLLTNATKFTDTEGAISVNGDVVGDLARVRVRDTGVGIPVDKLAAIFDPFVQVDSHFTRTREGIGLGLAISRDLARKMGGELSVESTIGVGSTFTVSLPRAR
jgi:hypothetical protein